MHGQEDGSKKESDNTSSKQLFWETFWSTIKKRTRKSDGSSGDHFFCDEKQFYLLRESGLQILVVVKVVFNCELTERSASCW